MPSQRPKKGDIYVRILTPEIETQHHAPRDKVTPVMEANARLLQSLAFRIGQPHEVAAAMDCLRRPDEDPATVDENHHARHQLLHTHFDELLADYLTQHHAARPSNMKLMDLMQWSYQQTLNPTKVSSAPRSGGREP